MPERAVGIVVHDIDIEDVGKLAKKKSHGHKEKQPRKALQTAFCDGAERGGGGGHGW